MAPTFRPGATSLRSHAKGVALAAEEEALREEPAAAAWANEGIAAAAAAVATNPSLRTEVSARVADRDILARVLPSWSWCDGSLAGVRPAWAALFANACLTQTCESNTGLRNVSAPRGCQIVAQGTQATQDLEPWT